MVKIGYIFISLILDIRYYENRKRIHTINDYWIAIDAFN
jgi:hypothetical protein